MKSNVVLIGLILVAWLPGTLSWADDGEFRVRSQSMRIDERSGEVRFDGNVVVEMAGSGLTCDVLVLRSDPGTPGEVRSGVASGNVVLSRGADRLTAGKAEIDLERKTATFTLDPVLERERSRVEAASIQYSIENGIADFTGPVRATFVQAAGEEP